MVIGFCNYNGGVGKTLLAVNLGGVLAAEGEGTALLLATRPGIRRHLAPTTPAPGDGWVVEATRIAGLKLSVIGLSPAHPVQVDRVLAWSAGRYAHVIMDCPPSSGWEPLAAAADLVLIPTPLDLPSLWSTADTIDAVKETRTPYRLVALGRSASDHPPPLLANEPWCSTTIRQSRLYSRGGVPAVECPPNSYPAVDFRALAAEIGLVGVTE